jgi:uncharacterized protein YndB with AHSA1/START domain
MARRVQIEIEFLFKASPTILYRFITSPNCLIRWFCDEVDIDDDEYHYVWDGQEEVAVLVDDIEDERLRFKWKDAENKNEYIEYRFKVSPITGETILEIVDWCDSDEVAQQKQLWATQIDQLRRETGG